MPELPEVEVTRRGVAPHLEDRIVEDVVLRREGLRWPFPPELRELLLGRRILGTGRRGKYLLIQFEHGTLIVHLGMSGRVLVSGAPVGVFHHLHPAPEKHDHVVLDLDNGARLTFNDARRFGLIDRREMRRRSKVLLERYGLDIDVDALLSSYSVAVRQIVAIARAVDLSGKVLVLDEPTASLDAHEVEMLFSVLRRLRAQASASSLLPIS